LERVNMDVKKLAEKGNSVQLLVKGVDATFMNGVRRAIMNSVPVFAVEDVRIYENSSVMFDEMLAHRLGMLPLKTDLKAYKAGEKVIMMLEKEGPATVYSRDVQSTDPKVEVVDKHIPLVKLAKGQKVKIEMDAVMGFGKEHVKWQPGIVGYSQLAKVSFDMKHIDNPNKLLDAAPGQFELKAGKLTVKDSSSLNLDLVSKARDIAPPGAVEIEYDENAYVLNLESFGGLEAKEIVEAALDALAEKTKEFKKQVKEL